MNHYDASTVTDDPHRIDDSACTPVPSEEGGRILTLDRVLRVARQGMCKEATVNVEERYRNEDIFSRDLGKLRSER
jgi:hypothetical protein